MELKFLGTGGGRYVTGRQIRKTAGILVKTEQTQIHVDPGPGALLEANKNEPEKTDAVLVSHSHLDHASDANAVIEMMSEAYRNQATVITNETALHGYGDIESQITGYHQEMAQVREMEDGDSLEFQGLNLEFQTMFHSDPKTLGFTVEDDGQKIGFWTDTEYSDELVGFYEGCDTLVVYCSRPKNEGTRSHTSLDDIPEITEKLDVSKVVVTHFGFRFLESDLEAQKNWLEEQIKPGVVFADDGMDYPGNRKLDAF